MQKPSKKLQALWDTKLKDSGFNDAEQLIGTERQLKRHHSHDFHTNYTADEFQAKRDFFASARHALHTHDFSNDMHKFIWKCYAHGIPIRAIAVKVGYHKRSVTKIIQRYKWEIFCL
jgi:hypothetical protein